MKQKYTLTIADMDINVITEESQESVEYIVGILDRKIREILLKSKRCSKNEAALLCALDLCADKIKTKEQLDEAEAQLEESVEEIKKLASKLEKTEVKSKNLSDENARLELENSKLRALLEEAKNGSAITDEDIAAAGAPAPIKEALITEKLTPPTAIDDEIVKPLPKKKSNRNRVGSMFDLLTFSDI